MKDTDEEGVAQIDHVKNSNILATGDPSEFWQVIISFTAEGLETSTS